MPANHSITNVLSPNYDFEISVANDVAIDVARFALPGKVMQCSPCPEVRTSTNENGRYIMKLNDIYIIFYLQAFYFCGDNRFATIKHPEYVYNMHFTHT